MLETMLAVVALAFVAALWDIGRRAIAAYRFNKLYWDRLALVEEEAARQAQQIKHVTERVTFAAASVSTRSPTRIGQR